MKTRFLSVTHFAGALVLGGLTFASANRFQDGVPHEFKAGEKAKASEVNENFDFFEAEVSRLDDDAVVQWEAFDELAEQQVDLLVAMSDVTERTTSLEDRVDELSSRADTRLEVHLEANPIFAEPGGVEFGYLVAAITPSSGPFLDDLTTESFYLDTRNVPPGGAGLRIVQLNANGRGGYTFRVEPIAPYTWLAGRYVVRLLVTHEEYRGQALVSFVVE